MRFLILIALTFLTTACATGPTADSEEQSIKKDIQAFANDHTGQVDMGMLMPIYSDALNRMIARGQAGVPYLVDGLKSDDRAIVAQCAFCLTQLKVSDGLALAQKDFKRFTWNGTVQDWPPEIHDNDDEYEFERLRVYIFNCKNDFK